MTLMIRSTAIALVITLILTLPITTSRAIEHAHAEGSLPAVCLVRDIISRSEIGSLKLWAGQPFELEPPKPPSGYVYKAMVIEAIGGDLPYLKCVIWDSYDKLLEKYNVIIGAADESDGFIRVTYAPCQGDPSAITLQVKITVSYQRTETITIENMEANFTLPSIPMYEKYARTLIVEVDPCTGLMPENMTCNEEPLMHNDELLNNNWQRLKLSIGKITLSDPEPGNYKVKFTRVAPKPILLLTKRLKEEYNPITVPPYSEKNITFNIEADEWKILYVDVEINHTSNPSIRLDSPVIDCIHYDNERSRYRCFTPTVRIVNPSPIDSTIALNVTYILYKAEITYLENVMKVKLETSDIANLTQLKLKVILLPYIQNPILTDPMNTNLLSRAYLENSWMIMSYDIHKTGNMIIVFKNLLANEIYGNYTLHFTVPPVTVKLFDENGKPLKNCTIVFHEKLANKTVAIQANDSNIVVYTPISIPPLAMRVIKCNTTVGFLNVTSFYTREFNVTCRVYMLTIKVLDGLGSPIENATVSIKLINGSLTVSKLTNESGAIHIDQLPEGNYSVTIKYKRFTYQFSLQLTGNLTKTYKLKIYPIYGVTLSDEELKLITLTSMLALTVIILSRKEKEKEEKKKEKSDNGKGKK